VERFIMTGSPKCFAASWDYADWMTARSTTGAGLPLLPGTPSCTVPPVSLLEIRALTKSFDGVHALRGVDLSVQAGRITGLIGPNGAGKTTLFNCISGMIRPDSGSIHFENRSIGGWRSDRITRVGLVRTFQIAHGFPRLSVLENLLLYGPNQPGERLMQAILRPPSARRRDDELQSRAVAIAQRLNLTGVLRNRAADLSGGQKKLLEIGRALMAEPRLLLLDEPVAGVNPTLAREIAAHLRDLIAEGITVLLIEHHMDTIAALCDPVVVMAEGARLREGSFDELANDMAVREAYMGRRR
jgi:branched-chain amino acid transport system ATP-binding protein/neutral amino acid transport system ATP-binding protein